MLEIQISLLPMPDLNLLGSIHYSLKNFKKKTKDTFSCNDLKKGTEFWTHAKMEWALSFLSCHKQVLLKSSLQLQHDPVAELIIGNPTALSKKPGEEWKTFEMTDMYM